MASDTVSKTIERTTLRDKLARELCVAAGHDPDGIGEPPSDDNVATLDHALPRWMLWRRAADEKLKELDHGN